MAFPTDEIIKPFAQRLWLSSPTMYGDELRYVNETFKSNWITTQGSNIDQLECTIASQINVKHVVGVASCTAALHLAIKLADVKPGDKVFCSDMTFSATANPIVYEGAIPVFIDIERDTWNMDPVALERAFELHPEVKVVVLAHLYGIPAKIDEIRHICCQNGAILIEDAAESLGATYHGEQTGSFGSISCISFNGNKIITGSSGGALLTNDLQVAETARKLSTQARENAPWYQHCQIGYNYRISNVIAGIICGQWPHLQEHITRKADIYERYSKGLKDLPVSMNPYDELNSTPNFWLSCLLIHEAGMAKHMRTELSAQYDRISGRSSPTEILDTLAKYNVEGRPIWKPMHMQPIFKNNEFVTTANDVDVGRDIFNRGLCLPSDIKMTHEQQDAVIDIIRRCFD